jgi:hypothetical protein
LPYYSRQTEPAHRHWCCAFIHFDERRPSAETGKVEVGAHLSRLAVDKGLATWVHRQALSAWCFFPAGYASSSCCGCLSSMSVIGPLFGKAR